MPEQIRGHRDSHAERWSWGPGEPPAHKRGPGGGAGRGAMALAVAGAGLIGLGALFLLLGNDGDDDSAVTASPTRPAVAGASRTPKATVRPTQSPGPTPIPASPTPGASVDVRLFVWSRQRQRWLASGLDEETPGYREGEPIPFMLRIDGAKPQTAYRIEITYECRTSAGAAFDYLTEVLGADSAAAMAEPGPGRLWDASIPVPDDAAISFDAGERRFLAWGASFAETPQGPLPAARCDDQKRLRVDLMAHADTVFLMWGAHLASASDWGANEGASSQRSPISVEISLDAGSPRQLEIAPEAIIP